MKLSAETKKNLAYSFIVCAIVCAFVFGVFVGQNGRKSQCRAQHFWRTHAHPSQINTHAADYYSQM